uniref:6-phosphogluconolactonase n=1 Tax=Mesocestoides corti TaxID=53468 RepID=A0A5K3FJL9_MESCO
MLVRIQNGSCRNLSLFASRFQMPRVIVSASSSALRSAVVEEIHDVLRKTARDKMDVSVGLSGGSMPSIISSGLIALDDVDWSRVHFFFCDERIVPFDDPESTFGIYQKELFSKLCPEPVVHKIDLSEPSTKDVAEAYQRDLLDFFGAKNGYPVFDLLLLGLGPDGHTCSLFPRHKLLEVENLVVAPITDSPKPPPNRVTLTLPVINKANKVIFIVTGDNKAEVIKKIIEGEQPSTAYPASMVQPLAAKPSWHLDQAAARLLTSAN